MEYMLNMKELENKLANLAELLEQEEFQIDKFRSRLSEDHFNWLVSYKKETKKYSNPSKPVLGIPGVKISVGESRVEREVFIPVIFNQPVFPVENLDPDRDPLLNVKAYDGPIAIVTVTGVSRKDKLHGLYPPPIDCAFPIPLRLTLSTKKGSR
jgi:hypothetical protein